MMRRWRSRVRGDGVVRLRIAAMVAFEQQSASAGHPFDESVYVFRKTMVPVGS